MPGVATESVSDNYPDLDKLSLRDVLLTHVLGKNGKYLIPVKSILEYAEPMVLIGAKNPANFYYDYVEHSPEDAFLNEEEWTRVLSHSEKTSLLQNMALNYEHIQIKDKSLLKNLEVLLQKLFINSVNGVGQEEIAGEDVYSALYDFKIFYDSLSSDARANVPAELRDELQFFFNLTSNKEDYGLGVENAETCIAIRREKLQGFVSEHRLILSEIGLTNNEHQNYLQEAFEAFKHFQKQVEEDFNQRHYQSGYDKSGLTRALLNSLKTDIKMSHETDVSLFFDSSLSDIEDMLSDDERLKYKIIVATFKTDNIRQYLLSLLEKLPEEKAKIFIEIVSIPFVDLAKDYRASGQMDAYNNIFDIFLSVLAELQGKKFSNFCKIAKELVTDQHDFKKLMAALDEHQCKEICEFLQPEFQKIVKSQYELSDLLKTLDEDKFKIVVEILIKNDLNRFFDNNAITVDLMNFLMALTEQQGIHFFNSVGHGIQDILIGNARQELAFCCRYDNYMRYLTKERRLVWKFIVEPNLPIDEQAHICNEIEFLSHEERGRIKFDALIAQMDTRSLTLKSDTRKQAMNDLVTGLKLARNNLFEEETTTKEQFVEACNELIRLHGPLLAKSQRVFI